MRIEKNGEVFECNPEGDCWCKHEPHIMPVGDATECMSPSELKEAIRKLQNHGA